MCDVQTRPSRNAGRLSLAQDEVLGYVQFRFGSPGRDRTLLLAVTLRAPTPRGNANPDSNARRGHAPVPRNAANAPRKCKSRLGRANLQTRPSRANARVECKSRLECATCKRARPARDRTLLLAIASNANAAKPCGNANPDSNVRRANAPVPRQRATKM
jgi:hypothetical protein